MLAQLTSKHAELLVRAVRDHLADCLMTLPTLLEREAIGSLPFFFVHLFGSRRARGLETRGEKNGRLAPFFFTAAVAGLSRNRRFLFQLRGNVVEQLLFL